MKTTQGSFPTVCRSVQLRPYQKYMQFIYLPISIPSMKLQYNKKQLPNQTYFNALVTADMGFVSERATVKRCVAPHSSLQQDVSTMPPYSHLQAKTSPGSNGCFPTWDRVRGRGGGESTGSGAEGGVGLAMLSIYTCRAEH